MPLPALSLPRRPPVRAVGACACVLALLGGGWLWLRDSGLVAVDKVSVTGLSGTEAPRVRAALEGAARDMTTLHVRPDQLRTAVEPYPAIMAVDAHPDFPHGLRIVVHEHVAVAMLAAGSDRVPVAADGTLLRGSSSTGLPVVSVASPPPGDTLADKRALRAVGLLAAAPPELRAKVTPRVPRPPGPDRAAGQRSAPVLRWRRPPAGQVDGGGQRARRSQLDGRHLHRPPAPRAARRGRPRGPGGSRGAVAHADQPAGRRAARAAPDSALATPTTPVGP